MPGGSENGGRREHLVTGIAVGGRTLELARPDKVLFPDDGITKDDLAEYYRRIAPMLLPHARGRPVTMQRFPDGIDEDGFFQQKVPDYFPSWIRTVPVPTSDGRDRRLVLDDAATLVYLAGQGCITPHLWLSTEDDLERPDRMVLDLDPPPDGDVDLLRRAARTVRAVLADAGLASRIMTTGSSGFHVIVPLVPGHDADSVRRVALRLARRAVATDPDSLTVEQRRNRRAGRVFIDYGRNAIGQTTVAPYAVRARPGAPVATPIDWRELGHVEPRTYSIANVFRRLAQRDDPWCEDGLTAHDLAEVTS